MVIERIGGPVFDAPIGPALITVVSSTDETQPYPYAYDTSSYKLSAPDRDVFVVPHPPRAREQDTIVCEIEVSAPPRLVCMSGRLGYVSYFERNVGSDATIIVVDMSGNVVLSVPVTDLFTEDIDWDVVHPENGASVYVAEIIFVGDRIVVVASVGGADFGKGRFATRWIEVGTWTIEKRDFTQSVLDILESDVSDSSKVSFFQLWQVAAEYNSDMVHDYIDAEVGGVVGALRAAVLGESNE